MAVKPKSSARLRAEMPEGRASILIVDDHPLVREGLAARIASQPDLSVCGEAAGVDEALELLRTKSPAVVIVDLTLSGGHGLDLIKKAVRSGTDAKLLVLTAHEETLFAERALRAGAHGFVTKQEAQGEVLEAIRTVLRGERYLSETMTQRLVGQALGSGPAADVESLSDRELEIFELIGRGTSTRAIAEQLHLSVHTVETHRENIRAKLGLRNGAELVQRAVRWVYETQG